MENVDELGVPSISRINGKIGVLERKIDFLSRRLEIESYKTTPSSEFDRAEVGALNAAVRALKYHAATLNPRLDPVLHLARLASAAQAVLVEQAKDLENGEDDFNEQEQMLSLVLKHVLEALSELV